MRRQQTSSARLLYYPIIAAIVLFAFFFLWPGMDPSGKDSVIQVGSLKVQCPLSTLPLPPCLRVRWQVYVFLLASCVCPVYIVT